MAKFLQAGFIKLRRGLLEHVQNGEMSIGEFFVYVAILGNADPATGVWRGSAGVLAHWYELPERTCRDQMEKLEKRGYIKRFPKPGRHTSYPILVNLFECSHGAANGMRLNAIKSTSSTDLVYEGCRDGAGAGAGAGAGKYLEKERSREEVQKPSRRKVRDKVPVDSRHTPFREALAIYWKHKNHLQPVLPWDGREAAALTAMLDAQPDMALEAFQAYLRNRGKSQVNHGEPVHLWIRNITQFSGELDRFRLPSSQKVSNSKPNTSALDSVRAMQDEAKRQAEEGKHA